MLDIDNPKVHGLTPGTGVRMFDLDCTNNLARFSGGSAATRGTTVKIYRLNRLDRVNNRPGSRR